MDNRKHRPVGLCGFLYEIKQGEENILDDKEIIELFFKRSEKALEETGKKYGALCTYIAGGILRNPEDAEEAVSSSYVKLWNAVPPKRPKSLKGYLCAIVRNTAFNAYEKIRRRPREELYGELSEIIPESSTVGDNLESGEIAGYISEYLKKAGTKYSRVFLARYYYDMPIADIADSLGLTQSAVKARLSRTREGLRGYLKERGIDV